MMVRGRKAVHTVFSDPVAAWEARKNFSGTDQSEMYVEHLPPDQRDGSDCDNAVVEVFKRANLLRRQNIVLKSQVDLMVSKVNTLREIVRALRSAQ